MPLLIEIEPQKISIKTEEHSYQKVLSLPYVSIHDVMFINPSTFDRFQNLLANNLTTIESNQDSEYIFLLDVLNREINSGNMVVYNIVFLPMECTSWDIMRESIAIRSYHNFIALDFINPQSTDVRRASINWRTLLTKLTGKGNPKDVNMEDGKELYVEARDIVSASLSKNSGSSGDAVELHAAVSFGEGYDDADYNNVMAESIEAIKACIAAVKVSEDPREQEIISEIISGIVLKEIESVRYMGSYISKEELVNLVKTMANKLEGCSVALGDIIYVFRSLFMEDTENVVDEVPE